jgi:hypothetical protein
VTGLYLDTGLGDRRDQQDGPTADETVFYVFLMLDARIDEHLDALPAVRAVETDWIVGVVHTKKSPCAPDSQSGDLVLSKRLLQQVGV